MGERGGGRIPQHIHYNGLRYARHDIAKLIPHDVEIFVEPFAGHAWVSKEVCGRMKKCVLGDIDPRPLEWIKKHHKITNAEYKVQDWRKTVDEYDSHKTFFLFDPPWNHKKCTRGSPHPGRCGEDYFDEIIEKSRKLKGKAILTFHPSKANEICRKAKRCIFIQKRIASKNFNYGVAFLN